MRYGEDDQMTDLKCTLETEYHPLSTKGWTGEARHRQTVLLGLIQLKSILKRAYSCIFATGVSPSPYIINRISMSVCLCDHALSSSERKELLTCVFLQKFFDDAILQRFGQNFRPMYT